MPDLQTALAALKLPAHFDDDNMVAAPDIAFEKFAKAKLIQFLRSKVR